MVTFSHRPIPDVVRHSLYRVIGSTTKVRHREAHSRDTKSPAPALNFPTAWIRQLSHNSSNGRESHRAENPAPSHEYLLNRFCMLASFEATWWGVSVLHGGAAGVLPDVSRSTSRADYLVRGGTGSGSGTTRGGGPCSVAIAPKGATHYNGRNDRGAWAGLVVALA